MALRRLNKKSRSKSDVLEPQTINDLQDLDGEKDAQKFYARHFGRYEWYTRKSCCCVYVSEFTMYLKVVEN